MKIPDKIKIGAIPYMVEFREEVHEGESDRDGLFIPSKQKMVIQSGMSPEYTEWVLLHEILHGVFDHINYNGDDEEDLVSRLTSCLLQVLKDNKLFGG